MDDSETIGLINGAAAGMLATVDVLGVDAVQNWEVDELLDWTTGLNFDDYWSGWKELATSAKSDKPVGRWLAKGYWLGSYYTIYLPLFI